MENIEIDDLLFKKIIECLCKCEKKDENIEKLKLCTKDEVTSIINNLTNRNSSVLLDCIINCDNDFINIVSTKYDLTKALANQIYSKAINDVKFDLLNK